MVEANKMKKAKSKPIAVATGAGICMIISVIGAFLVALLIDGGRLTEDTVGGGALAITLLSAFFGSFVAVKMAKEFLLPIAVSVGAAYYILLISATALLFSGRYNGLGVTALIVFCGCLSSVLLVSRGGAHRKKRFRKVANR